MGKVNVKFDRIPKKSKAFQKKSDDIVISKYEKSKTNFINEVESHPVSQEISAGPTATNISNTLGGVGNLFSFIGFNKSQRPIDDLMNAIKKSFSIKKQEKRNGTRYIIDYATLEKIRSSTLMPWESGNSWAIRIEKGISGFSNYMYKRSQNSRSGTGIQAKNNLRSGSFKRINYLTDIINRFIINMQK